MSVMNTGENECVYKPVEKCWRIGNVVTLLQNLLCEVDTIFSFCCCCCFSFDFLALNWSYAVCCLILRLVTGFLTVLSYEFIRIRHWYADDDATGCSHVEYVGTLLMMTLIQIYWYKRFEWQNSNWWMENDIKCENLPTIFSMIWW